LALGGLAWSGAACGLTCEEIVPDYSTPTTTFRTFMQGFVTDCPNVEYFCLSQGLKAREHIGLFEFLTFRHMLEDEYGFQVSVLRTLDVEGDVEEIKYLSPREAIVTVSIAGQLAQFRMVREGWIRIDASLDHPIESIVDRFVVVPGTDGYYLKIVTREDVEDWLEPDERQAIATPGGVSGVTVEPQWKIDSFPHLTSSEAPRPQE